MLPRMSKVWMAAVSAVLVVASAGMAQTGSITGGVVDSETQGPIAGVRIEATAPGLRDAAGFTDSAGRFRLTNLAPGTYTVSARIIGYEMQRVTAVEVRSGVVTEVEFRLTSLALLLNPVVVSASRRQERALDAPASVSVVDSRAVEERPAVTPVDHVRSTPGVDIITTGVQSSIVVARGFNNIFSGSLHALTDHRIAGIPSLRVNLLHFAPTTNEDIERIEVVLGPGSALYGPNTASGVLHIFTKSPLADQGTTLSLGGGERELVQGSFRTAHLLGENFGLKVSGQYLRGNEWPHLDATEQAERQFCHGSAQSRAFCIQRLVAAEGIGQAEAVQRVDRIAIRDEQVERWGGEVRADLRLTPEATAILSVGSNTTLNAVELTGLGAGQVKDWRYTYYQARLNYDRLFAQVYLNTSDAGGTYLLRNGSGIVDRSKLLVGQVQHGFELGGRQNFTYGMDYIRTMPDTDETIHGRHEDDDLMSEFGAYVQSETALSPQFDLVLAGRVDTHSHLDDAVFSPRAALVFKPSEAHSFRATYNSAFSTPSAINLFLDLGTPFPTEAAALSQLGYSIRVQGTLDGIRLRQNGQWMMRSPFTPAQLGGPNALIAPNAALMWQMAVAILQAQGAIDAQTAQFLATRPPTETAGIGINTWLVGTDLIGRLEDLNLPDVAQVRESNTRTFEIGYKGLIGQRVLIAADVWHSQIDNFVTPLLPQTSFLMLNPEELGAYAVPRLVQHFMEAGMPAAQAQQAAVAIVTGMAQLPLGVISSDDIYANGPQVLLSYRNFGDVKLWGTDIAIRAMINDRWSLGLAGSLVSDDHFLSDGQFITLNAPKRKGVFTLGYRDEQAGFHGEGRIRYTSEFPAASGVYFGAQCIETAPATLRLENCAESYTLFDLTLGYRLPFSGASIQATVQNVFDTAYRSFPGVAEAGRLGLVRLRYEF